MFKKLKDRLSEVGEEVKRDPRFQNSLASVNRLASDTLSTINRDKSPTREDGDSASQQQINNNLIASDQFFR